MKTTRKKQFGNNRSKAMNATPKIWKLNRQKFTFIEDGKKIVSFLTNKEIRTIKNKQTKEKKD